MQVSNKPLGFFLVIDGIDGSGKSTLVQLISHYFAENNIPVCFTTEPTQNELGKILRKYLADHKSPAALDALVFAADRIEHCKSEILPALDAGKLVISDRYRDSSYVYQTIQGQSQGITLDWMQKINKFSESPDLTIILDLDPEIALQRKTSQNQRNNTEMEKFEEITFQKQIRGLFLSLAEKSTNHVILNATLSPENLLHQVVDIVSQRWKGLNLQKP